MAWGEAKISVRRGLFCLPDILPPAPAEQSQARPDPAPARVSASLVSGNSPPGSDGQSVAASVPRHHRYEPPGLLALSASPNATKPRSSAPLPPYYDPPSTGSRSRVASASPTSSSPSAPPDTPVHRGLLPLRGILRRARIYGTDTAVEPQIPRLLWR